MRMELIKRSGRKYLQQPLSYLVKSNAVQYIEQMASVTGLIISNMVVSGSVCRLMTKALHRKIECRQCWESVLCLDSDSIRELQFWLDATPNLNRKVIWSKCTLPRRLVYSDASNIGCAAYKVCPKKSLPFEVKR